jgi:hypothetical protein
VTENQYVCETCENFKCTHSEHYDQDSHGEYKELEEYLDDMGTRNFVRFHGCVLHSTFIKDEKLKDRMIQTLKDLEWSGSHTDYEDLWAVLTNACPWCMNDRRDGHKPDCELEYCLNESKRSEMNMEKKYIVGFKNGVGFIVTYDSESEYRNAKESANNVGIKITPLNYKKSKPIWIVGTSDCEGGHIEYACKSYESALYRWNEIRLKLIEYLLDLKKHHKEDMNDEENWKHWEDDYNKDLRNLAETDPSKMNNYPQDQPYMRKIELEE